jgi:hypothetical protein
MITSARLFRFLAATKGENMKMVLLIVSFFMSVSALASEKICFGAGEAKGGTFLVKLSTKSATIKVLKETDYLADFFDGTHKRAGTVDSREGIAYFVYDLGTIDCALDMLVAETLLKAKTTGKIKMRCRGEGFSQETYYCKDNQ